MKASLTSAKRSAQAGFGHLIGMALVVLAFTAIGFIGYKLYANPRIVDDNTKQATSNAQTNPTLDASSAPQIKKTSDLDTASALLDQVGTNDTDSTDTTQLDAQLNSF